MTLAFQRVLIIKLKHLGDVLTTTPVLGGIASLWPEARVSYLVNPGAEDLVRHHPMVDTVFTFPRGKGLGAQLSLIMAMRRKKFDLVLELSGGDRGAFLAWTTGARVRVGYAPTRPKFADRRVFLNRLVITRVDQRHTVEYHLDALRVLDVEPGDHLMSLHYPDEARQTVRNILKQAGIIGPSPYAVVHPSSRWMFKAWTPEGNAAVIDYLTREKGLKVVVTSAPDKTELTLVRDVLAMTQTDVLDLSGRLNLMELAALIDGARMFFGVDSLPMHMAAALATPAVALFGPSGEHMWGPWGPGHEVVAKDWECRPCGRDGCGGSKSSRCLKEMEPEEVFPALDRVLRGDA